MIKRSFKTATVAILLLILSILAGGGAFFGRAAAFAYSSEEGGVISDLSRDENFNVEDYPIDEEDFSLQVIQIAESTAGELYIYVYQPAVNVRRLTATEVRISQSIEDNLLPKDFKTTLLSRNGVFAKYKVEDITIKSDIERYYEVICIFRAWNGEIDKPSGNDNDISFVSFEVGKLFTAKTINGSVEYSAVKRDVVTITDKYVDFLRYEDGASGILVVTKAYTDSHYIAFSTDWKISDLYEIDITFRYHSVLEIENIGNPFRYDYEDYKTKTVTLTCEQDVSNNPSGWIKEDLYKFNRIETVRDFISNSENKLKDSTKEKIKDKQWIVRFFETDYTRSVGLETKINSTEVSEVSILRLYFKSNCTVYNLGVVDDKRSGDDVSGNKQGKSLWEKFIDFCKFLESITGVNYVIWAIIFLAVPVCLLLGVLSIFFPVIRRAFKCVFKGIWLVISAPFRFIAWIVRKIRGDDSE